MNRTSIKYFHYFIACICFDLLLICGVGLFFNVAQLHFLAIIWFVSNFINYPKIASRRFISYYQLLILTIKQYVTFLAIWTLGLILMSFFNYKPQLFAPLIILSAFASRILFVFILRLYRIVGRGFNRFYMIGNSPIMTSIKNNFLKSKSHGYVFEGQSNELDFDFLRGLIINRHLNEVYCSAKSVNQNELSQLLGLALHYGVNIHVVSDIVDDDKNFAVGAESLLFYSELGLEDFPLIDRKNLIFKRIFDIIFSSIIILTVLWWVWIIVGILIKIGSRGPILYKQPRAGREGKYFTCLKFRSMKVTSSEKQATKNDDRITKIGRFIRKTSIDELPQFVNVFLGEMSVVGPRPHPKLLNDQFGSQISNYDSRLLVKPGITGLSQVSGLRGETAKKSTMTQRVKVDLIYIKNWSLAKDISIISKTIFDLLFLRNKDVY